MAAYTLAARQDCRADTVVELHVRDGSIKIGAGNCTIIAGSCAVESREQYLPLAQELKEMGVQILRGGAFKPRSSPYSFQGLGEEGLHILAEARELTGLPVVTEVMDPRDLDMIYGYTDLIQVGSRNMQNFSLLKELGRIDKPVILKRGLSATLEEWLLASEYILAGGNEEVILCERGIRTFEDMTRNTVDIGGMALVKELSHLPVIVDPSHATGRRSLVAPVARAAVAAGADGLMIEVHQQPDQALSDGAQSLSPETLGVLLRDIRNIANLANRSFPGMDG